MATSVVSTTKNLETFSLVWFDPPSTGDQQWNKLEQRIRQKIAHVNLFDDFDHCYKYLQNLPPEERVIIIVNETLGEESIAKIHSLSSIHWIYVHYFGTTSSLNEHWLKKFNKIRTGALDIDELVEKILSDCSTSIRRQIEDSFSIQILNATSGQENSTTGLNGQFLSSQLLIDCLLSMVPHPTDKNELIDLCKQFYEHNPSDLTVVQEFETNYSEDRALWWYTRESFLYRLLNKALRIQDIELLFLFRFFIRDLYQELKQLQLSTPIRVFRGQLIGKNELESLKSSVGDFISMNSFLSTSIDRRQAVSFLHSSTVTGDLQRVLLEIDLDPVCATTKPFANITSHSFYTDEQELLIMLGSIFRLVKVEQQERFCIIQLVLCSDDDNKLKSTFDYVKQEYEEINGETSLFSFGVLLFKTGKYDKAEKFSRRLLRELPKDHEDLPGCYHNLGVISNHQGNFDESLQWFNKAKEIYQKKSESHNSTLAITLNSLGEVYFRQGNNVNALNAFNEALAIRRKLFGEDHLLVAKCYHNIGNLLQQQKKLHEAYDYHQKSLNIRQKHLPADHPDLGASYHSIAGIFLCLNNVDLALQFYTRALKIYQKCLPSDHTDVGMIHYNLGLLHAGQSRFPQALAEFRKAEAIFKVTLTPSHPFIAIVEQDIRRVSGQ